MPYISARYMPADPIAPPDAPRNVQAVDDQGLVWSLTEDSQVGDWLRYLEEGGTIEPEATPELVPEPEPETEPEPEGLTGTVESASAAATEPMPELPQAEPGVVYGQPVPE